jgi:predicted RNA-binding protein
MCLSTAYKTKKVPENMICEYVSKIKVNGDNIILTDIMNCEVSIKGILSSVDLEKNEILIEPK